MYSVATTIAPTATATRVLSSGEDAAGTLGGGLERPRAPESGLSRASS